MSTYCYYGFMKNILNVWETLAKFYDAVKMIQAGGWEKVIEQITAEIKKTRQPFLPTHPS